MRIDLEGKTTRIEGAANQVTAALRDRLAQNGAVDLSNGLPDLLILSAPLLWESGFDWDGLADMASDMGAAMKVRGSGRIVFLMSACAGLPIRREPDLSIRAAALHAAMRALAMSLAPEVAVNAVGAGAIGTDRDDLISGQSEMIGHTAIGRPGSVREVCDVALFLCDPDNGYLTGQLLSADGGWAAGYGRSF